MVNRAAVIAWVAALRSGEFTQGRGSLATFEFQAPQYCCLGVASEVAIEQGVIKEYSASRGTLPTEVSDWLDIPDVGYVRPGNPVIAIVDVEFRLSDGSKETCEHHIPAISANDEYDFTFGQIADCLEYFVLGVPVDIKAG